MSEKGYLDMELLRFTTAGSVVDGKSTLIGRLLYDSKSIFEDQLQSLKETNSRKGEKGINLALLTDGLRAEREQGITIDVAYRKNPKMLANVVLAVKYIPKLRTLIFWIPLSKFISEREKSFFGSSFFFISSCTSHSCIKFFFF